MQSDVCPQLTEYHIAYFCFALVRRAAWFYGCYFASQPTVLSVIYLAFSTLLSLLSLRQARLVNSVALLFSLPSALMKTYCWFVETSVSFLKVLQQLSKDFYWLLSWWLVLQQVHYTVGCMGDERIITFPHLNMNFTRFIKCIQTGAKHVFTSQMIEGIAGLPSCSWHKASGIHCNTYELASPLRQCSFNCIEILIIPAVLRDFKATCSIKHTNMVCSKTWLAKT